MHAPLTTPRVRQILHGASIQPKLKVGAANDPAEAEADRVADRVMRMPAPAAGHEPASVSPSPGEASVRRMCVECEDELHRKPAEDALVQPKEAPGTAPALTPSSESAIMGLGGGSPLPASERAFFEPRFGRSFEHVRIHNGPLADTAAKSINARAFTLGTDIAFAGGEYSPGSSEGRRLMAHELTHSIQESVRPTHERAVHRQTPQVISPTGPNPLVPVDVGEWASLVTPSPFVIPDILDLATLSVGLTLGRPLSGRERRILQPVYGSWLDYSLIRICSNAVCSPDGVPRTIGNLIATPAGGISNSTLIHEAAHVWQHQNGIRYSYIVSSLVAQFGAWLVTGSRSAAYNWHMYYNHHIPWCAWNAEAQAQYIEDNHTLPPWYVWGTGGLLPVP